MPKQNNIHRHNFRTAQDVGNKTPAAATEAANDQVFRQEINTKEYNVPQAQTPPLHQANPA